MQRVSFTDKLSSSPSLLAIKKLKEEKVQMFMCTDPLRWL